VSRPICASERFSPGFIDLPNPGLLGSAGLAKDEWYFETPVGGTPVDDEHFIVVIDL
jgi:hypothetical protein